MTWLYSVIAGLLIAVVYACATWMGFQCRKQGTLLPRGLIVEKYGALISMLLYGICGIALIVSGFLLGWWVVITIVVTWFAGGRLAIYAERLCYARDRLDAFQFHAKRMLEQYGEGRAIEAWNMAVPRWWINLMSWAWEREYKNRVGSILKSVDPTDPLFSEDTFMAEYDGEGGITNR